MLGFRSTATHGVFLLAGALLTACGSGGNKGSATPADSGSALDGGDDVSEGTEASVPDASTKDGGADSATDAALGPHAPLPQVVDLGGTVLTTPKVQLIVYTEDPLATDVDDMITELTQTSTWAEQTSEYGVGALTKVPTIQIAGTPPTTLDDSSGGVTPFEQTLVTNTTGTDPIWGAADPSTIYAFLIPAGTNVESGDGNCCSSFFGYHFTVQVSATIAIPYAVICDCTDPPYTPLENTTTTVNHELVEAATDPLPDSNPAYEQEDRNDIIWKFATGGEVADMCDLNADQNYLPPGSTYMVQRTWSNAAAMAGTNPCVPPPTTPFFDSMAVLPDSITLSIYGTPVLTKGVQIAVGASKTIDVQLFSTAPTSGPWHVTAYDMNAYLGGEANTTLSLDKTTGSNGDVLHLTIKVNSADPDLGGEGFFLISTLASQQNITVGAIAN
jgi:hypothetical protein